MQNVSPNETQVTKAFTKQAVLFDALYTGDTIIQYKRERVRQHIQKYLAPGSHILELNAGTGEDAVYFAEKGHRVHATDISHGMLDMLHKKVTGKGLQDQVTHELCSYTSLEKLADKGPYDHIFSNFAGLNCTNQLDNVLRSLPPLLKPGGTITLVILPKFCLWEFLLILKGKTKTALRRFGGKKGAVSHVEGEHFICWYYDPSYVISTLANDCTHLQTEGLCTLVPPSYISGFAEKHPRMYSFLCRMENRLKYSWPWRSIGDYYIITLRKNN